MNVCVHTGLRTQDAEADSIDKEEALERTEGQEVESVAEESCPESTHLEEMNTLSIQTALEHTSPEQQSERGDDTEAVVDDAVPR